MPSALLSVREVAEILGVRQHGVLALIRSGELRAADVSLTQGGRPRWRISPDDLDGFLLRRIHQAAPPRRRRRNRKPIKQWF